MSGTPKYSQAELDRRRREQLEAERQRRAEAEARRRAEAEERERRRRFEQRRSQAHQDLRALMARLSQVDAYPDDLRLVQDRSRQIEQQIQGASVEGQVQQAIGELDRLNRDLDKAIDRKRRDDDEKKRVAELEKQGFRVQDLTQRINRIPLKDASKFDPEGQTAARQVIDATQAAISHGDPVNVRTLLEQAEDLVSVHEDRVAERRAEWQQRFAQADQAKGDMEGVLAGLQADEVVIRWHREAVRQLQGLIGQAEEVMAREAFEEVTGLLEQIQLQAKTLIGEANAVQLKADQRDLIANSMAQVLQEMGFVIVQREFEHPDHPASAIVMAAANNAGKGISISVPTEGEIFYDVEGYPKNLTAAVCDEAEAVLNEMHQVLAEEFGIQMGEVMWEGKDPNRILRRADELPRSRDQQSRGA